MERLRMTSPDLTRANVEKIASLFPTVVTETLDANGEPTQAVDFDLLRQELAGYVVEGPQERYHLDWPGKRAAAFAANAPIAKTLRPVREESVDFDTTKNLFIEGDNLEALKLLQESYLGKVKLIYIDPPYNTGNDFVYEDDFAESSAEYLARSGQQSEAGDRLVANPNTNGRYHSDWLSMMYPRLKLAKSLLASDGVLIAAIDDNEQANLKAILDEVLGPSNFIATVVWQGGRKNDSRYVSVGHDYMLIYARDQVALTERGIRWREKKHGVDVALAQAQRVWEASEGDPARATSAYRQWLGSRKDLTPAVTRFKTLDKHGRVYNADKDLGWPGGGGPKYDVLHPATGRPVSVSSRGWALTQEAFAKLIAEDLVEFGPDETKIPRGKTFLDELDAQVAESVFTQIRTTAGQELAKLMGPSVFPYPKDVTVLARWFDLVTSGDPHAIILDFFAGSGSTGHAVMKLNARDGGKRRFICVQLPETMSHPEFATIADASRERLRRAGANIDGEAGGEGSTLDVGFRSFRIDTTNMAGVSSTADGLAQGDLLTAIESVKPGRSGEDLLFQVMLDWGLDLSLSIERTDIEGHRIYSVDNGAVVACFDDQLPLAVVREIASQHPLRAVFLDASFANDAARINAEQVFREVSPETDVMAI